MNPDKLLLVGLIGLILIEIVDCMPKLTLRDVARVCYLNSVYNFKADT